MKKLTIIIAGLLFFFQAKSQVQQIEVQASGLTCSMCSNAINKALKGLLFVQSIETDLNKNIFIISVKPGMNPDFDLIKKKVEDAGFSVANFWLQGRFNQVAIKNDEHITFNGMTLHFMNVKDQVLSGTQKIKLVDKNFVSGKEFKKMSGLTQMGCYASGYMQSCCTLSKKPDTEKTRIFHVTI